MRPPSNYSSCKSSPPYRQGRPCQRCVKRGLADQCTDGVRKKAKYLDGLLPVLPMTTTTTTQGAADTAFGSATANLEDAFLCDMLRQQPLPPDPSPRLGEVVADAAATTSSASTSPRTEVTGSAAANVRYILQECPVQPYDYTASFHDLVRYIHQQCGCAARTTLNPPVA